MQIATYTASANIAVVKYWGKRNEEIILPQNSSLSFTMDEKLQTITSVMFSKNIEQDELWLNGQKIDLSQPKNRSHIRPVDFIRQKANIDGQVRIVSKNLFPTGAGFASSASGVAALVCATAKAANLSLSSKELSILARQGSGSASRSVYGGFVEWKKGSLNDGSDSYAEQIFPHDHWPELRNVIAVVQKEEKKISSRYGMKTTTETSSLYQQRVQKTDEVIAEMKKAVGEKNFASFAKLTMQESNSMHACMLDTWPPIMYLSDRSKEIMWAVQKINEEHAQPIAAYTFDAGPNAHVYTTEKYVANIREILQPHANEIFVCNVGSGPKHIEDASKFLIDATTGEPRI